MNLLYVLGFVDISTPRRAFNLFINLIFAVVVTRDQSKLSELTSMRNLVAV